MSSHSSSGSGLLKLLVQMLSYERLEGRQYGQVKRVTSTDISSGTQSHEGEGEIEP